VAQLSVAQRIEQFHLALLEVLHSQLDPSTYVLKGGANLRYFYASDRYSEDIDLDMVEIEPWRLADKVNHVLESSALATILRGTGGFAIEDISAPKQTETTRRWKIGVAVPEQAELVRTKIEFSNRNGETRYVLEAVPADIVAPYALRAPSLQHYEAQAAGEQKVLALALRSETQARDVFDLDLLFRRGLSAPETVDADVIGQAIDHALELPFNAYRDQVLPFLMPAMVDVLGSEEAWTRMQVTVADRLKEWVK
jgi:predicted nucleotidyltransferase component of viral defense system